MVSKEFQEAIDKILNSPIPKLTREESKQRLISLGIIDEDENVTERFKNIFVKSRR